MNLLPRHATDVVISRLQAFRVVVVTGARQVGKSTLARLVLDASSGRYLTLDDPLTLEEAVHDPDGLIAGAHGLTVIDEVQREPRLLRAVKLAVDRDPTPGRFLLTGSANLLSMRTVTESLAGRAAYLELLPLSWSEIALAHRPRTIDDAFAVASAAEYAQTLAPPPPEAVAQARARALAGGMPEVLGLSATDRRVWFDSYRTTFLERDLRQLSLVTHVTEFGRFTSLCLLRSAGLLNKSDLAADARVSHSTADRYLDLLQTGYQVRLLPPFFSNVAKRHVKSPRLFAVDVGAASWAANASDWRAAVASGRDGALLETLALSDIIAWDSLAATSRYSFWRTGAGAEVDLVIERGENVVAVEVKGSATLSRQDSSGLRALRADLGDRFRLGIVAYLGEEVRVIDEQLLAVPLASLLGAGQE